MGKKRSKRKNRTEERPRKGRFTDLGTKSTFSVFSRCGKSLSHEDTVFSLKKKVFELRFL